MIHEQVSAPRIHPLIQRARIDWWVFLRGLILLLSSFVGITVLYSILTLFRG
jgi:hypothetical protein